VSGYTTEGWGELFLAEAGASAALGGLLFVAVSINLDRIIALRSLPGAALGAIVLLVAVLMVSTFVLVPGQPRWVLGTEVLVVGIAAWSILTAIWIRALRAPIPNQPRFVPGHLGGGDPGGNPPDGGRRSVVAGGGWRWALLARPWGGLLARSRGGQRLGVAG
jgi:hypothetical protein